MDRNDMLAKHKSLLGSLISLPKQILSLNHLDNVTEFVLHDLCTNCFNLNKAAYFIDNPDFDTVKGIAGYDQAEKYSESKKIWQNPDFFTNFMKSSKFNNKIRNFDTKSVKKNSNTYDNIVKEISKNIGFENPSYCLWDLKHNNHGLLVYEKNKDSDDLFNDHFLNSLYLLSFCPIH